MHDFKIGEKVKVVGHSSSSILKPGERGVVVEFTRMFVTIEGMGRAKQKSKHFFTNIRKIESEVK
ncbi:hypothetical protein NYE67_20540 [Solibacillus sp. FSL W8-0474]|uniref:hypothetical protein n=1 Tax=Solibacillus sp. FSL W8-0474 TaxID=2975336 RepID=UPI0030F6FA2A